MPIEELFPLGLKGHLNDVDLFYVFFSKKKSFHWPFGVMLVYLMLMQSWTSCSHPDQNLLFASPESDSDLNTLYILCLVSPRKCVGAFNLGPLLCKSADRLKIVNPTISLAKSKSEAMRCVIWIPTIDTWISIWNRKVIRRLRIQSLNLHLLFLWNCSLLSNLQRVHQPKTAAHEGYQTFMWELSPELDRRDFHRNPR